MSDFRVGQKYSNAVFTIEVAQGNAIVFEDCCWNVDTISNIPQTNVIVFTNCKIQTKDLNIQMKDDTFLSFTNCEIDCTSIKLKARKIDFSKTKIIYSGDVQIQRESGNGDPDINFHPLMGIGSGSILIRGTKDINKHKI